MPRLKLVLLAVLAPALVAGWLSWGPSQLGGGADYVIVHGASMRPTYGTGDLILTRPQDHYEVGDIVSYHNPRLKIDVMHRIIGVDGDRFVLRGDNNDYTDSDPVALSQIHGRADLQLPGAGRRLLEARNPPAGGFALGAAGLVAAWPAAVRTRRRHRHGRRARRARG